MDKHICWMCKSEMEEKTISTMTGWGEYKTKVKAKTCVCPKCGETVFSAEELHRLQELGKELAKEMKNK